MNRAQVVQAIAACDALGSALREQLKADAAAEYAEQGTAPTWRMPGYTVSTALTAPKVVVDDEGAWLDFVAANYPSEVVTVRQVRPAFAGRYLSEVLERGDPPCADDGTVLPFLRYEPGGAFQSVRVVPNPATRTALKTVAAQIATGQRPLGLPQTVEVEP